MRLPLLNHSLFPKSSKVQREFLQKVTTILKQLLTYLKRKVSVGVGLEFSFSKGTIFSIMRSNQVREVV